MKLRNAASALLCATLGFLWVGGVIAHLFLGGPPPHVAWTAPFFLVVAGSIVFLSAERKMLPRLAMAGTIGIIAEIVGVHTGFPFGKYEYTTALYPRLFEVPLVMGCAWVVLAAFVQQIVAPLGRPQIIAVPVFATLLTAFDLLIDPVAAGPLAYWTWQHPGRYYGIPVANFCGWWIVSACIALLMNTETGRNPWHQFVGCAITSFFTVLAAANGMILPALAGIALLILPALFHRTVGVTMPKKFVSIGDNIDAASISRVVDSAASRNSQQ